MKSNSFERFQALNKSYKKAQELANTHFIYQGYPSTEIVGTADEHIQAAVVNKDEKEEGYIFTPANSPLTIGSVWKTKTLYMLVDHEVVIIKDVNWHKYHFLTCNAVEDDWYGYFIGPEKSHINLSLKKDVVLVSQQKPLLITAGKPFNFRDKIRIGDRAWVVDEYDSISTQGITYYSLMTSTMTDGEKVEHYEEPILTIPETTIDNKGVINIGRGQVIELSTENGYFKPSIKSLDVVKHTATSIQFKVPFGIKDFTITIKEKGAIVVKQYCVIE